jgi:hypothetical protein
MSIGISKKKKFLSEQINFNTTPIMWEGSEVFPGPELKNSNHFTPVIVVQHPLEPIIPDIFCQGNEYTVGNKDIKGSLLVGEISAIVEIEATKDGTITILEPEKRRSLKPGDIYALGNITAEKNLKINGQSTLNKDVRINAKLLLANCGDVAKRIDRADRLPSSDQRLKTNITPIKSALSKVLELNGVEFDFIDNANCGYLKKHQIGLIAQDVEKVIPEVVGKNKDDTLGVSYQHLVAVLIEAIKEQQQEIDELKRIVSEGK